MRHRRKPPSLVSMWMLDVFCCALGCVTLLWLLNTRLAGDERAKAISALADLTATRDTLLTTRSKADSTHHALTAEIERLKSHVALVTAEREDLSRQHAALTADLASEAMKNAKLVDEFQKKLKEADDLNVRLAAASQSRETLQKLLRDREVETATLKAKTDDAGKQLRSLEASLTAMTKEKTAAMARTQEDLAAAKAATRELQKQIDDSQAMIVDLQGDKRKLADTFDKLKIESDTRFAGIAMTGRRVVFLVDMSGSMRLLADKVEAPKKWETVIETLVKVMRSLPDLQQYQIVTFAMEAKYLAGPDWQKYNGESTLASIRESLLAIKPEGDTNLYDAFDLAFRLKPGGLDTIYLFSDGLPTRGPASSKEHVQSLSGPARTEYLVSEMKTALQTTWNPPSRTRVKINSIGFFYESPEVGAFLWALSRDHDGSFVGMSRP